MQQKETTSGARPVKSVCIIGGGISGLSLAYYLLDFAKTQRSQFDFYIIIREKESVFGGNCDTMYVKLDDAHPEHNRWADMGVNDYNKKTYKLLNELMAVTKYNSGLPLEDMESYGNLKGTVCYTNDGAYNTKMSDAVIAGNKKFKEEAHDDSLKKEYAYYTLEKYVREKEYSEEFIYSNLFPRVNGMYFCPGDPGTMPFRTIMQYYSLQEGYGADSKAERMYFKDGSIAWIKTLVEKIKEMGGANILRPNLETPVTFIDGYAKPVIDRVPQSYDAVVLSLPADEAVKNFDKSTVPFEIINVLSKFKYHKDQSIVHTDTRCMQPQVNSQRTYNIHVFDRGASGPYTISYVLNRHQNDCNNSEYKTKCENPQYFMSANPVVAPATSSVLKQVNNNQPAVKMLSHQKIDIDGLRAQEFIENNLQGKYRLYYANGYVIGAGLHEECLQNSYKLAAQIAGVTHDRQVHYDFSADAKQFAPDYLVHAHSNDNHKSKKD